MRFALPLMFTKRAEDGGADALVCVNEQSMKLCCGYSISETEMHRPGPEMDRKLHLRKLKTKTPTCMGWRFALKFWRPGAESNHRHKVVQSSVRERGARTGAAGLPTHGQMFRRRAILEQLAELLAQLWRIVVMVHRNRMVDSGLQ
jgi:hypothetical protein